MATDSLTAIGPRTPGAALAELALQPDRPGAAPRPPAQGRRLVPRARRAAGQRRVLHRVRLGGRGVLRPAPADLRRLPRGPARGALAVQALQPRRLPLRLRRRRPGRGRRAARRTQEPRPDHARPPAARHDRGARRRPARRGAARAVRRPPRGVCATAFESAGFRIDHSEAALYLWASRDERCWDTVAWLADRGILVAPGSFYGRAGEQHVRIAFTATDERVAAAADRLR